MSISLLLSGLVGLIGIILVITLFNIILSNKLLGLGNRVEKSTSNIDVILEERLEKMDEIIDLMERGLEEEQAIHVDTANKKMQ